MNDTSLVGAKRRVGRAILGHYGVHGVGTATSESKVVLHLDPAKGGLPTAVFEQAKALAQPFDLAVVEEAAPRFGAAD